MMPEKKNIRGRSVEAVHAVREIRKDPDFEHGFADHLRSQYSREALLELYGRFAAGKSDLDHLMRRAIWRAVARRFGNGVVLDESVGFKHLETFEIGDGVFIGTQAYLQGRMDGQCVIGNYVWVGPQCCLDARDLRIGDFVGLGPGAKVLGSTHVGIPIDIPLTKTDLQIKPVRIETEADIGTNAVILPGVTVGKASIVGAGAVVTKDVAPFSVVAGVPARFLSWRKGYEPPAAEKAAFQKTAGSQGLR